MQKLVERSDFSEIRPNFLPAQAILEAQRCLYCFDAPCREGCPAGIDIPHFIQAIRTHNLKRAARIISRDNPLGSVCGRVCPVERLCEEKCTARKINGKSIQISMLQRYAVDNADYRHPTATGNGRKVAVVGSGPAGLSCAVILARNGYEVTVFESKSVAGGMVALGVPQYRCPHQVTQEEIQRIESEGVEIRLSTPVNQDISQLFQLGYEAVFVGVGLTRSYRPDMPGMELSGIYMGLDFLNRIGTGDTPPVGKRVVVVGGGDTALDCARSALRLGAEEATIMYRRSMIELPADSEEIHQALEEGIIFRTLTNPVALHGDEKGILRAVEAVNIKLGSPDESGRRSPAEIRGSNFRIPCNTIIFAIGTEPSNLLKKLLPDVEYKKDRFLVVDPETCMTSREGVFAGGDVVNQGATVVEAVAEGKKAALGIMAYLEAKPAEDKRDLAVESHDLPEESSQEIADGTEDLSEESSPEIEDQEEDIILQEGESHDSDEIDAEEIREELKEKWKQKLSDRQGSTEEETDPEEDQPDSEVE